MKDIRSVEELEKRYFPQRALERLRRDNPEAWIKLEAKRLLKEAIAKAKAKK